MSHVQNLQARMKAGEVEAILVSSEINQRYLTALNYTDGYVLVLPEVAYLLADFRYIEVARETAPADFEVVMPEGSMLSCVAELLAKHGIRHLAYEEETVSCAQRIRFADTFPGVELMTGGSRLFSSLRIIKDAEEIEFMTRAQKLTDDAFAHILNFITPERTELEVALELEFYMRAHGSEGTAFETIAVSGANSSKPHGVPGDNKLTPNAFFTMDFGARYNGYCADMTRTVVLGKADDEMKRLYNTVLLAQTSAIEALQVGMACCYADKVARDIIDNAGYKGCFGHSLGHGVGLFIHENPRFAASSPREVTLQPGHVVTVEPGIYIAGKYGCRIEDMITVLPDGTIHDFTQSPKQLIEL